MTGTDLEHFHQELFQSVCGTADADHRFAEDAFFEHFCAHLVDAGEMETADRSPYISIRGIRIDGYGGDPIESGNVLTLVIADFNATQEVETLTATEMRAIFKRAMNFIKKSLDSSFRADMEESAPAYGLCDLVAARWERILKVRVLLISNRVLSSRVDGHEGGVVEGVSVSLGVWDLSRLHRFVSEGREREEIVIDLDEDYGGALQALPAHLRVAGYESYLVVIPGPVLAEIYDNWGPRMLEQNVRVFLQARGKVNKGIRITLENEPQMFFAYNNGITATAESVETTQSESGLVINSIQNLQIVNGGQTTASIHAASRGRGADLSRVFVQMKLSIVDPGKALEIVPKISEYANTQNRVNAADFFANHPFHVRIEAFSRRIYAPSPDGTFRESKWFYERARGQYQDARAHLTAAARRKFDLEYPKRQMLTKTDLAKCQMVWRGLPDIVSKGAQKCFGEFARLVGEEWTKKEEAFNELYYRSAIARAIMFRRMERLVTEQPWYEGGYRANIVAYGIAKLGHDVDKLKMAVDLDGIWREQKLTIALERALVLAARAVHEVLVNPPSGVRNVTEWAKRSGCWDAVKKVKLSWPGDWVNELVTACEQKDSRRDAVKAQKLLNGIEAQLAVVRAGGEFWRTVKEWGVARGFLTALERGVLDAAMRVPKSIPSEKQCAVVLASLAKLQAEGCQLVLEA